MAFTQNAHDNKLSTPTSGVLTNCTGTATGLTSGITQALASATTTVNVSAATAPSTGQVLTATDSTHATWQSPSSAMTLISSQTASTASTVDFTSGITSTYSFYMIVGSNITASTASVLQFRFQQGGSFITSANYDYVENASYPSAGTFAPIAGSNQTLITTNISNNTTRGNNIIIEFMQPNLANYPSIFYRRFGYSGDPLTFLEFGEGTLKLAAATTGVRIFPSSGTINGTFKLYGIT